MAPAALTGTAGAVAASQPSRRASGADQVDAASFGDLFDEHYGAVVAYARRRGAGWDDAHHVAAEVFAVAWRRRADVPAGAERAWLLGVARRVQANQWRGQRRWRALLGRVARATTGELDEVAVVADTDPALARALAGLSARDREVLCLVAWDGLRHAEAAIVLGCSTSTVSTRVARARTRLRRALDDQPPVRTGGT